MTDVFLSGWCGFPSVFGGFSGRFEFFTPFYDDISPVFTKKGRNLVCWSTGANFALKQRELKFDNIILVSPFVRFTDYTGARVLKRMIKKFETDPSAVIDDFMTACGVKSYKIPEDADYPFIKSGLEYLLDSGDEISLRSEKITVIHGESDAVVNIKSGREIAEFLGCELVAVKGCGHFVPPDIISGYML